MTACSISVLRDLAGKLAGAGTGHLSAPISGGVLPTVACFLCRADKSGQTALHWAAVRGSLLAGESLLSHGADLRIQDGRGYTTCHVAAQYGQTAFIYMCALRWRADIDRCAATFLLFFSSLLSYRDVITSGTLL